MVFDAVSNSKCLRLDRAAFCILVENVCKKNLNAKKKEDEIDCQKNLNYCPIPFFSNFCKFFEEFLLVN